MKIIKVKVDGATYWIPVDKIDILMVGDGGEAAIAVGKHQVVTKNASVIMAIIEAMDNDAA